MATKICTKCGGPPQPIENFALRNRAKGTRQPWCRQCQNEYVRAHYIKYRGTYLAKARRGNYAQAHTNDVLILEFLCAHPCVDCGEADPVVLELDHLRDKRVDVSAMRRDAYSREALFEEIAKCEVVCANCHRRRTAMRGGSYRLTIQSPMRP